MKLNWYTDPKDPFPLAHSHLSRGKYLMEIYIHLT